MTRQRPTAPDMSALLGETARLAQPAAATTLPVSALKPGKNQPRRAFDAAALSSLADSIRSEGILQPLLVRPVPGGHEIVAGERRWRAAQLAGLTEVPVLIRTLTDQQAQAAALIENLQRQDLNVIDEIDGKLALVALTLGIDSTEARARLMQLLSDASAEDEERLTTLFQSLGETWRSFAKNKLRVLRWPAPLIDALRAGLPMTLAGVIAGAPEEHQAALIAQAQKGASRTELRAAADILRQGQRTRPDRAALAARRLGSRRFMEKLGDPERAALEQWLSKMPAFLLTDASP